MPLEPWTLRAGMPLFVEVSTCMLRLSDILLTHLASLEGSEGGRPLYGNDPLPYFVFSHVRNDEKLSEISNLDIKD